MEILNIKPELWVSLLAKSDFLHKVKKRFLCGKLPTSDSNMLINHGRSPSHLSGSSGLLGWRVFNLFIIGSHSGEQAGLVFYGRVSYRIYSIKRRPRINAARMMRRSFDYIQVLKKRVQHRSIYNNNPIFSCQIICLP